MFNTVPRFKNFKVSLSIRPTLSTEPRKCSGETSIGEMTNIGGKKGEMTDIGAKLSAWPNLSLFSNGGLAATFFGLSRKRGANRRRALEVFESSDSVEHWIIH